MCRATAGSAAIIPEKTCYRVKNIMSQCDPVPVIADPINFCREYANVLMGRKSNLQIVRSQNFGLQNKRSGIGKVTVYRKSSYEVASMTFYWGEESKKRRTNI
jgi:hypothetical protein